MAERVADTLFQELAFVCGESRRAFGRHVGMSEARRQLLTVLANEGETSHSELQGILGVDGAAITRLVKGLEAAGTVRRRLNPDDNRYMLASLTSAGEVVVAELRDAHRAFQARLLRGIGRDDQAHVLDVLQQLRTNLAAVREDTAPGKTDDTSRGRHR